MNDTALYVMGIAIGAIAIVLLGWGWWGDRPRGRRRCPKCWYDMTSVETRRCSECGYTARRERRLTKTRRRRRAIALGMLGVVGATALCATPRIRRDGWTTYAPTVVLAVALRASEGPADPIAIELFERLSFDASPWSRAETELPELSTFTRRRIAGSCAVLLANEPCVFQPRTVLKLVTALGVDGVAVTDECRAQLAGDAPDLAASALAPFGADDPATIDAIVEAIRSSAHPSTATSIMTTLRTIGPGARRATPFLHDVVARRVMTTPDESGTYGLEQLVVTAVEILGTFGASASDAVPALGDRARDGSLLIATAAARALGLIAPDDDEAIDALIAALQRGAIPVADAAGAALQRGPAVDRAAAVLAAQATSTDMSTRVATMIGIRALAPSAPSLLPVVELGLEDDDALVRFAAVVAARRYGAAAHPLESALRDCARDPNPVIRAQAEAALRAWEPSS